MKSVAALGALLLLGACAAPPIPVNAPYIASEAEFSRQPGERTISGQALLRQNGGGVVTCAGLPVTLMPDTSYQRARIAALYGNIVSGYNPNVGGRTISPSERDPAAVADSRTTTCDAQGNFAFTGIPPGSYHVFANVVWTVGGDMRQGGGLMRQVTVGNRDVTNIILTQ